MTLTRGARIRKRRRSKKMKEILLLTSTTTARKIRLITGKSLIMKR